MKVCQAYKFKLKTDEELENKLMQFSGACRFVWNKSLALIKDRMYLREVDKIINVHIPQSYRRPISIPTYYDMANLLTLWKHSGECAFLNNVHSQILQQTLKDLCKSIDSAFIKGNGIHFPTFKKKGKSPDSFRYLQGFKVNENSLYLPKIGWVRFYKSRDVQGKMKNATVKHEADGWYISIAAEREVAIPEKKTNNPIGIDVGVKKVITVSNGQYFKPIDVRKYKKKLIKMQRQLTKKQHPAKRGDKIPASNNYKKQKAKIAKLWLKITNARNDYPHKITTVIAQNHSIVAVENLKIKNMTKSAKGTVENPGHNVKAKSGLNRSILTQSWGRFFELLEYKLILNGGKLIKVNPKYTPQMCSLCGYISKHSRKNQAVFVCEKCGYLANADLVASINILKSALGNEYPRYLPQGFMGSYACGVCIAYIEAGTSRKP